jgi:hypothetical protein
VCPGKRSKTTLPPDGIPGGRGSCWKQYRLKHNQMVSRFKTQSVQILKGQTYQLNFDLIKEDKSLITMKLGKYQTLTFGYD